MTHEQLENFVRKYSDGFFVFHSGGIGVHDEDIRVRLEWEDGKLKSFCPSGGTQEIFPSEDVVETEALLIEALAMGMNDLILVEYWDD